MSERILVTGATGKVGQELVQILAGSGAEVTAATRRPNRAASLFDDDVEVVELDYEVAATFDGAVEWADRVFLQPPPLDPDAHKTLGTFLDWTVQAGTEHVVALSAMGMEEREDLPIRRLERHIDSLGIAYTFLRPNIYMQNFSSGFLGDRIRRTGAFSLPVNGARVSFVDGRDVAAVAARALSGDEHVGRSYTLTGPEALDHAEVVGILSEVAGREITFSSVSDGEMREWLQGAGWRPEVAEVVLDLYRSVRDGVREAVTGDIEEILGRPPTSFRQFAGDRSAAWQ